MEFDIYSLLFSVIIIFVLSAVIVPFFSVKRKLAGWMNFLFSLCASIPLFMLGYISVFGGRNIETKAVNFGFLNLYFYIDPLSGFFIGIISFMAVIAAFYSIEYMEHYSGYNLRSYYINFPVFILGMIGVVTTDDLSTGFSLSWQLMTLSSFFLIRFENRKEENLRIAKKYLILMELAWIIILSATFLIDGIGLGDPLHKITDSIAGIDGFRSYLIFGLLFVGFGLKAGIFPLGQLWLPDAHSIAPSPISSLLSGVMIKTGIYGILRTFFWMVPHGNDYQFNGFFWGAVISAFGVLTLLIGTIQSMKQSDLKRLLAYSSIGQIGYIVFGTGAALFMYYNSHHFVRMLSLLAITGVIYHILNHAVFKGLLFLVSGSVLYTTRTRDLNKLGGLLKFMPLSAVAAGIGSLSISGVPPFSGFASKWTIISSSLLAGSEVIFLAMFGIIALFTSTITLACYVKFFGMTFTSSGAEWTVKKELKDVPATMIIPKIILAVFCLLQGILPFFYFRTITGIFRNSTGSILHGFINEAILQDHLSVSLTGIKYNLPGFNGIISAVIAPVVIFVIIAIAFIAAWLLKRSAGARDSEADTWLCGYQELSDKNRYRDRNMFAALKNILWWAGGKS